MKIDWKTVAGSPGYKSMKAAVAKEAATSAGYGRKRDKRYEETFRFAINRAKHYAHRLNKPIEEVLNEWESKRKYCFLNYYQSCNFPKFHSNNCKPMKLRGTKKYYKRENWLDPKRKRERIFQMIQWYQRQESTKDKKRWDNERKRRARFRRSL